MTRKEKLLIRLQQTVATARRLIEKRLQRGGSYTPQEDRIYDRLMERIDMTKAAIENEDRAAAIKNPTAKPQETKLEPEYVI